MFFSAYPFEMSLERLSEHPQLSFAILHTFRKVLTNCHLPTNHGIMMKMLELFILFIRSVILHKGT